MCSAIVHRCALEVITVREGNPTAELYQHVKGYGKAWAEFLQMTEHIAHIFNVPPPQHHRQRDSERQQEFQQLLFEPQQAQQQIKLKRCFVKLLKLVEDAPKEENKIHNLKVRISKEGKIAIQVDERTPHVVRNKNGTEFKIKLNLK